MQLVKIFEGESPIILTQPHGGTYLPKKKHYNKFGLMMSDTDWHINKLYDGLLKGVSIVQALFSRYFIDVNRDPTGQSLYSNQNTTELCPTKNFFGQPIYKKGMEPNEEEIAMRIQNYHSVYNKAISDQLERIKLKHGTALLFDCHSIRSKLPFLFKGELPDFNLGTNGQTTCDAKIEKTAVNIFSKIKGYKFVLNGRFKGGWTIRHFGDPKNQTHAIQLELSQKTYMEEFYPWNYNYKKAKNLRMYLKKILHSLENHMFKHSF